jgi:hypothetical protein
MRRPTRANILHHRAFPLHLILQHRTFPLHLSCTRALCLCLAFTCERNTQPAYNHTIVCPPHILTFLHVSRHSSAAIHPSCCCHLIRTNTSRCSKHRLSHHLHHLHCLAPTPPPSPGRAHCNNTTPPRAHTVQRARQTTARKAASSNFLLEALRWLQRATRNISLGNRASPRDPRHKTPTPVRHQAR